MSRKDYIPTGSQVWKWFLQQLVALPFFTVVFIGAGAAVWELKAESAVKTVVQIESKPILEDIAELKEDLKIEQLESKKSKQETEMILFEVRRMSLMVKKSTPPKIVKEVEESTEIFRPRTEN